MELDPQVWNVNHTFDNSLGCSKQANTSQLIKYDFDEVHQAFKIFEQETTRPLQMLLELSLFTLHVLQSGSSCVSSPERVSQYVDLWSGNG